MKILLWNTEWRSFTSNAGKYIRNYAEIISPSIICYTEVSMGLHPEHGEVIYSESDYGYKSTTSRRKVSLWTDDKWTEVDTVGSESLPSGRFVSGITHGIRFIAICIPWSAAHVSTGRKDRERWQDHRDYLKALQDIVAVYKKETIPICILGDYNQRIPIARQPQDVFDSLTELLQQGFNIPTANLSDNEDKLLIDHIAVAQSLKCEIDEIHPKVTQNGLKLSDHVMKTQKKI